MKNKATAARKRQPKIILTDKHSHQSAYTYHHMYYQAWIKMLSLCLQQGTAYPTSVNSVHTPAVWLEDVALQWPKMAQDIVNKSLHQFFECNRFTASMVEAATKMTGLSTLK